MIKNIARNLFFKLMIVFMIFALHFNSLFAQKVETKKIIGQKATVKIKEGGLSFIGRVDTGAETTSINASKIKIDGDFVEFFILNKKGEDAYLKTKIIDEKYVKNAEKREKRYYVYLTIEYKGFSRKTLVNLNDRSTSTYKILLGRNWLMGHYMVDVSIE